MSPFPDPAARLQELAGLLGALPEAALPLALLPVHLETRFVTREDGDQLLVRIRPDTIWVDAHEPGLTARELEWGRRYWEQVQQAGDDEVSRRAAWSQLASQFGEERAAWVARALAPGSPDPATKEASWTEPAVLRGQPERWVVLGYRGGRRVVASWGEPVAADLAVTPPPDEGDAPDVPDDELALDPRLRWLVDFAEAERVGMGIRIPLPPGEAQQGFDTLLALGVRDGDGGPLLAELLTAQAYSDGVGFVAPGTPTNNTDGGRSGFSSAPADLEPARAAGRTLPPGSNGALAAAALGIDPAVFLDAAAADGEDDRAARAMGIAVWPLAAYFSEQFLQGIVADGRSHFLGHVRAAGPLQAMRVGRQPYGLLPVVALDRVQPSGEGEAAFVGWLRSLRGAWRSALSRVPGPVAAANANGLLDGLRLDAASVDYQARLVFDQALFGSPDVPIATPSPPAPALAHRQELQTALQAAGSTAAPRLLDVFPSDPPFPLAQPANGTPPAAYLEWLRTAPFAALRDEVYRPALDLPDRSLKGLLYLTLRHAVLLAYGRAGYAMLGGDVRYREPGLVDVVGPEQPVRTESLTRLLERSVAALGERPLAEIVHTLTAAQHPAAAELDELRDALGLLATRPAEELDRLLRGTLDLFAYRLDAWITSLATRRLAERRRARPRGVALGGYGWVEGLRPAQRTPVDVAPEGEADGRLFVDPRSGGALHAPSLVQAATAAILRSGFLSEVGEGGARPLAIDLSSSRARLAAWLLDGVREGQPFPALLGYRFERALHDRGLDRFIAAFRRIAPLGPLAEARVARENAERELRRIEALPHPEAVAAQQRVAALRARVTQLTNEQASLPNRLAAAQAELAKISSDLQDARRRLGNLILRAGEGRAPPWSAWRPRSST